MSVEPSRGRVRLVPYGVHGPLRWFDLQASPDLPPPAGADDTVEWIVPMPRQPAASAGS